MDKLLADQLVEGARRVGVVLGEKAVVALGVYLDELGRWRRSLNLTAIEVPAEIVEKHFVDSLAVVPWVEGPLLDIGTGAGFPGMVVKIARPEIEVELVDSVAKKISFLKALMARLDTSGATAKAARAEGRPDREGIATAQTVVSRAVEEPAAWLQRAAAYVGASGRVLAMVGHAPSDADLRRFAEAAGLALRHVEHYRLWPSGAERAIVVCQRGPNRAT